MVATLSENELGHVLLTLRGVQWIMGTKGDPYALVLRASDDDPHDVGRAARERGALFWSSAQAWVTADHELVSAVLDDPRLTPSPSAGWVPLDVGQPAPWVVPGLRNVLPLAGLATELERHEYERLRGWAASAIADTAASERWQAAGDRIFLDRIAGLGERFDLMADLVRPAVVAFTGLLLGMEPQSRHGARFALLGEQAVGALDATLCPPGPATARRLATTLPELAGLLTEVIGATGDGDYDGGAATEDDSVVARLLGTATAHGAPLDVDVHTVSALLATGGAELAADLLCNAVDALLDHPDQWELLRADPGLVPAAIDETLRYAPPVRLHRLYAREEFELAGNTIAVGEEVVVLIEAAQHDPSVHEAPDRFDLRRATRARHFVHAEGVWSGLVGPLVRLQAEAGLRAIVTAVPLISRTGEVPRRLRSPLTRGVLRFPAAGGAS
ncbi:P450-derived glycosyltransferase activator [Streptomyces graminilatus]|uniref:cytochrome P450 family protein n=1 Tax=Streptomyces graminilatus TaxID=1464070 RepID=UPI0007C635BB|nr:P450-derived glycosyltransferase activator [Streptomyces graminilatus]